MTNKHPLDAVESALVDASNALQDALPDEPKWKIGSGFATRMANLDEAIDAALRLVQAEIRRDLDPPDPRD